MNLDTIIFAVSAVVAIFGAVMMIGQRNPIASVLYLILSMVAQAVLYVQLGGLFIGAILVVVYAGAIMVLFLFVIMLLNLRGKEDFGSGARPVSLVSKYVLSLLMVLELAMVVKSGFFPEAQSTGVIQMAADNFGTVDTIGQLLFTKYLYPFELTSILLVSAIVGAVVIARKRQDGGTRPAGPGAAESQVGGENG